jgi:hypothetical protein
MVSTKKPLHPYLDLSKPYQQNNPQSAKKDNQATALLKEVAGTARYQ